MNPLNHRLRKLIPNRGMAIDVPTWAAAHEYHADQLKHHNLGIHDSGIVSGLEVTVTPEGTNLLTVHPGIAIDPLGNQLVVRGPQILDVSELENVEIHITLEHAEIEEEDHFTIGHDSPLARFAVDGYEIYARSGPPGPTALELARIRVTEGVTRITDPCDFRAPNSGEIDHRYRKRASSGRLGHINIGLLELPGSGDTHPAHTHGALSLIQAINALTNYSASFVDCSDATAAKGTVDLLLLSGFSPFDVNPDVISHITEFVSGSGVIFGEACNNRNIAEEANIGFRTGFNALATVLEREFTPMSEDHPVLHSVFQFAQPPDSINGAGVVVVADNLIYSDSDYGCLWGGGVIGDRSMIRDAIEFGINIAVESINKFNSRIESRGSR